MTPETLLRWSVVTAVATIILKTAAWQLTGSVGLLSDAMESLVNLAAALFSLAMVGWASHPPDVDHPFGHGKAEYFASGFESLLILAAALLIAANAVGRLLAPQPLERIGLGLILSLASSALNGGLALLMRRAASVHRSIALEADARHLFSDVWTSVGLVIGLILVHLTGLTWLDPVLALLVAAHLAWTAARLMQRSAEGLMDHALPNDELKRILDAIDQELAQPAFSGTFINHLRTREAARQRFCGLHLHVPAAWTIGRAMQAREELAAALVRALPGLTMTIELLPAGSEPAQEAGLPPLPGEHAA